MKFNNSADSVNYEYFSAVKVSSFLNSDTYMIFGKRMRPAPSIFREEVVEETEAYDFVYDN